MNQPTAPFTKVTMSASKRRLRLSLLIWTAIAVSQCLSLLAQPAAAQSPSIRWSQPVNLSNSPASSGRPAIVADDFGYVHVFWSEEVGGESILDNPGELIKDGNTIFYTRWDGVSWTPPVDILFVPGDSIADYVAVAIDEQNWLHAVWTGQSNYYYSTAPSWRAHSASSWSAPVVVAGDSARTAWAVDITVAESGTVHILYTTRGNEPGMYHISSNDRGASWDQPVRISGPFRPLEISISTVKVITDGLGRLHTVWQTNQKEGYGQAAYYSSSTDNGRTWTSPVEIGYRDEGEYDVSYPFLAAIGDSELHMVYIDGPWHNGRWHRVSQDGGETWSEPSYFLGGLEGVNGYTILLTDIEDGLHVVVTMRTLEQVGGQFYTTWSGSSWLPEQMAIPDTVQTGLGAHWTAATVRLGNEIHMIWNTNFSRKAGEIWHSRGEIPGMAQVPALDVPVAEEPVSTPVETAATHAQATSEVALTQSASPTSHVSEPPPSSEAPLSDTLPLVIGIAPPLLLIIGIVAWRRVRSQSS